MAGLFMIKDFQTLSSDATNPFLNVYGFRSNVAIVGELGAILDAFVATMLPVLVAIQSDDIIHQRLEAYELNTVNFQVRSLTSGNQGARTGGYGAKFEAWGFRLNRAVLGTRSGLKRIGVPSDADVSNGAPVAGILSALNAYATAYGSPMLFGVIQTWFPVILHRPVAPSTTWTDDGTNGATFVNVTTQNTRKS